MKIAIVGSEEKYWTLRQRIEAKHLITQLLCMKDILISGGCHKGGVDIWAEEWADIMKIPKIIYLPKLHKWKYYKERNILIAEECDILFDIEPEDRNSGGYWTYKYAKKLGKKAEVKRIY